MSRKQLLIYLLAFIVSAVVLVSLLVSSFFSGDDTTPVVVAPSPSSVGRGVGIYPSLPPQIIDSANLNRHPSDKMPEQTITQESEQMFKQDRAIAQLIKKLPYHSTLFVLRYDIETNSFIASLIQAELNEANRQLDQYLKDNGIENRNWLYNLTIKQLTY